MEIANNFLSKIQNVDVVSFDIFDTLLHRKLAAPIDLFELIRSFLLSKDIMFEHHDVITDFPNLRRLSEKTARENHVYLNGGDAEITFEEIYQVFKDITEISQEHTDYIKKVELYLESLILYRSSEGYRLYKLAIDSGKRIYYISDMYLPVDYIRELLINNGYQVIDSEQIYISGEHRISKHSGKLFDFFLAKNSFDGRKCLHVGDNHYSDIVQASAKNIKTHFADWSFVDNRYKPKKCHINDYVAHSVISSINLPQHQQFLPETEYEMLGYQIWGPLLFGYMSWMVRELQAGSIDKVLFFARDARFIMELYNQYFRNNIPSDYVYLSRASLIPLSFTDWTMHRVWKVFSGRTTRSIKEIFELLRIDISLFMNDLRQMGFETIEEIITPDSYQRLHLIINKLYFQIMKKSSELRKEYQSYFRNLVADGSKIALIDIGWGGNIQSMFLRTLADDWVSKSYFGLYLGTFDETKENISPYVNMKGWLTSNGEPEEIKKILQNGGVELLEFVLTTDHGSTLSYKKQKGKIIPCLENHETEEGYANKALSVQAGIRKFFEEYKFLLNDFSMDSLVSSVWANPFLELVNNPTERQIELLASLSHSDTAGRNSSRSELAKKVSFKAIIMKNAEYKEGYDESYWKAAFKKRNSIRSRIGKLINN